MEPALEDYSALMKKFYTKVVQNHPSKLNLKTGFNRMVIEMSKDDAISMLNRSIGMKPRKDKDNASIQGSSRSLTKSQKSGRAMNTRGTKSEYFFLSPDLNRIFTFSYFYHLIDTSNESQLKMTQTKVKLLMQSIPKTRKQKISDNPSTSDEVWSKDFLNFKKVMQLLSHKNRVRWERILKQIFTDFNVIFIQIFVKAFLNLNTIGENDYKLSTQNMQKICEQLKISILYFECQNDKIIRQTKYGKATDEIKLGYVKNEGKFCFFDRFPFQEQPKSNQLKVNFSSKNLNSSTNSPQQPASPLSQTVNDLKSIGNKSQVSSDKSDTSKRTQKTKTSYNLMRRKVIRQTNKMISEYEMGNHTIKDLECLKKEKTKEQRIKQYLTSRSKKQI